VKTLVYEEILLYRFKQNHIFGKTNLGFLFIVCPLWRPMMDVQTKISSSRIFHSGHGGFCTNEIMKCVSLIKIIAGK
jgi:hypothetical protein